MTRMSAQGVSGHRAVRRPVLHQVVVWISTLAVLVTSAGAANAEPSPSPSVSPALEAPALVPSAAPAEPTVAVPSADATASESAVVEPVPVAPVVLEPIGDSQVVEALKATEPILPESTTVTVGGASADDSQWAPSATAPSLPDVVDALALGPSDKRAAGLGAGGRWDLLETEFPRVANGDKVDVNTLTVGPDALGGAVFALNFDRSSESPGGAGWMNVSLDTTDMVTSGAGGLGDRLTLMAFPACALTTPERASCVQGVALPTDNAGGVLSAMVPVDGNGVSAEGSGIGNARTGRLNPDSTRLLADLAAAQGVHMAINGGTIVAAVSKANGPTGTFAATDLGMTGSWSVGEQSGAMSYSIPLSVPQVALGAAPSLALTYSSATVDGHNIASNGQGSIIGDGWDINIPYIERQYLACKFDRVGDKTGDLCWQSPYASKPEEAAYVINLNGQTANLIWDGENHGTNVVGYFVDGVPNWRVTRTITPGNATRNGDNDAEYFKVETPDGSVFYFGYGELPGPGNYKTNSAAVVPVFGDDAGEPCFGASPCTQAYRWMLDLSVDSNQIAQSYKYTKWDNYYAVSGVTTNSQAYTAEILPSMITYGRTFTDLVTTLGPIGASITFQTRQRCVEDASLNDYLGQPTTGCPTMVLANAASYPDVPIDLICTTAPCTSAQSSPAFFHRYRLAGIETISGHPTTVPISLTSQVVLVANFPPASDGGTRSLWLDSVYTKYTGVDASTATTYRTEFIGAEMRNRVDPGEQDSQLMRRRIVRILTDSGSAIDVDYSSNRETACANDPVPLTTGLAIPAPAKDCYQVMLTEIDGTPKYGAFHKYLVNTATVHDLVGGQPAMATRYEYLGAPGWGYANDLLRPDGQNDQTWSSWRGYGRVKVSTLAPVPGAAPGAVAPVVSSTTNTYFRGLDTDYLAADNPRGRVETLSFDPPGPASVENVPDSPWLQGMLFASETRDADGKLVSKSRQQYESQNWLPSQVSFPTQAEGQYAVGDFNGDGTDDLFARESSGQWKYWSPVTSQWTNLWLDDSVPMSLLAFGDFNGDGTTDVFTRASDGLWKYSAGGAAAWTPLILENVSAFSELRFGNFDVGATTDVYSRWRYSPGGSGQYVSLLASGATLDTLQLGNFAGDTRTDIFTRDANDCWKYALNGLVDWVTLRCGMAVPIANLRFADITGDGKTDVMSSSASGQWQVSTGASSVWTALAGSPNRTMSQLLFGNFDGDVQKRSDVLFPKAGGWSLVTGAQMAAKLDPATSASADISGVPVSGVPSRPNPAAMDGIVVLPSESKSWSYAPDSSGAEYFYASSKATTTYNADALPIEEKSVTTDGTDTFKTRTTTDYVWGYGGTTVKHDNPGHTSGFGTAKHIVLPWESKTYSETSKDAFGEALTGHVKVFYDDKTEATNVPSRGLPTTESSLGTDGVWRTSKATYDTLGRILTAQDPGDVAAGNTLKTNWAYVVNPDQKGMDVKVTSPDLVVNHTWYDFRTGGPTKAVTAQPTETEAQGQWTHYKYNAAGMLVAGWGPLQWGSTQTADPSTPPGASVVPTVSYSYDMFTSLPALRTKPVVVTTMSLAGPNGSGGWLMTNEAGTVRRSYQYLDGLLRPIETHSVAQDLLGGTLVTASGYDALGQVAWSTGPFELKDAQGNRMRAQASSPRANLDAASLALLDQVTYNLHDTSWRPTGTQVKSLGTTISSSSTSTVGLTTTAKDPTGLTTIAVSDVAGRLVSQKQVPAGVLDPSTVPATIYAYARAIEDVGLGPVQGGSQTTVTDTEGRATVLFTDFEGRKVWLDDPNSGYTSYEYSPYHPSRVKKISAGTDASHLTDVTTMTYDTPGRLTDRTSKVKIGDPETPLGVTSSSAHWEYGTGVAFSHVLWDTATTVVDGTPYTLTHSYTYDAKHRPDEVTTALPGSSALGDLSGQGYTTKAQYDPVTGTQTSTEFMTAIGGLPAETVTTGFDLLGRGVTLTVGENDFELVKGVEWDATGLLTSRTYGDDVVRELQYDLGTRSVSRMTAGIDGGATFQDDLYVRDGDTNANGTIDEASDGTVTSITDAAIPASPVSQCYLYNGLNRLESAWTITGSGSQCASNYAGNTANRDTSAKAYGSAWEYSSAGSINTVTDLLAEVTREYAPDTVHPAAVASITNPDIPAEGEDPVLPAVPVPADTFTYDALGRMISRVTQVVDPEERTVTPHTLTLTWDASSNLVKTVEDSTTVIYLYDSSGQRVAQIGVTAGTATAYLGATEAMDPNTAVSGNLVGTRYYSLGGATVATRTGDQLSFLFGDVQGSAQVMVTHTVAANGMLNDITGAVVSRNAYTPYGTTRGADNLTTVSHGWLNQVSDEASTGLVYLNARYYDPLVARFISPDPMMNPSDPKTLDPYRYAENNPVTYADASGLAPNCGGMATYAANRCWADWASNYTYGALKAGYKSIIAAHGRMTIKEAMGSGAKAAAARAEASYRRDTQTVIDATWVSEQTDFYRVKSPSAWGAALAVAGGAACGAVSGGTLAVACFAAAGAAGGLVDYSNNTSDMDFSDEGALTSALIGGVVGGVAPGVSSVLGRGMSAAVARFPVLGTELTIPGSAAASSATARTSTSFVVRPNGETIIVPQGAVGPLPVRSGNGFQYTGGQGGHGLDPRVTGVRIMDPKTSGTYQYPYGYVSYMNTADQAVNPWTGRTATSKADPWWHWSNEP